MKQLLREDDHVMHGRTEGGDVSYLTGDNTRLHSAQNRSHLQNNPAHKPFRVGWQQSAFCSISSNNKGGVGSALLPVTGFWRWLGVTRRGSCRPTHHHEGGETHKVSLSGVDPHGSLRLGHARELVGELQLPDDHLAVQGGAELLHLEIHLEHLQQAALQPGWRRDACGNHKRNICSTSLLPMSPIDLPSLPAIFYAWGHRGNVVSNSAQVHSLKLGEVAKKPAQTHGERSRTQIAISDHLYGRQLR